MELYQRVKLCQLYLLDMERQTSINYYNLASGVDNRVAGIDNIVLG